MHINDNHSKTEVIMLRLVNGVVINYTYFIKNIDTREVLLVDPSWTPDKIDLYINDSGLILTGILLTHSHFDHTYSASFFNQKYQVPVFISKIEKDNYNVDISGLKTINSENSFQIGKFTVKPFLTPGHTSGSTCYLIDNNLFTGDTLFIEGCGMCFGDGSDPHQLYESMNKLKTKIAPDTKIYPGHSYGEKPGVSFNFVQENNVYLQVDDIDTFVSFRMRKGQRRLFDFK